MTQLLPATKPLVIAQISDCHLFADIHALHHGANVYQHLKQIVTDIATHKAIDLIIFTGDLTQDHSVESYQHFTTIFKQAKLNVPVYYLAGNHDEPALMRRYLAAPIFNDQQSIDLGKWQIQLIDSKSETPAGKVSQQTLAQLKKAIKADTYQLFFMHHHPVDVGYFIDQHGLLNQDEFWRAINELPQAKSAIKAIACGHVHRASLLKKYSVHAQQCVDVYTCPATSIAFDPSKASVSALAVPPSFRLFSLYENGALSSDIIYATIT